MLLKTPSKIHRPLQNSSFTPSHTLFPTTLTTPPLEFSTPAPKQVRSTPNDLGTHGTALKLPFSATRQDSPRVVIIVKACLSGTRILGTIVIAAMAGEQGRSAYSTSLGVVLLE